MTLWGTSNRVLLILNLKVYYANHRKNAVSVVNFLLFILWISWKNRKFAPTS